MNNYNKLLRSLESKNIIEREILLSRIEEDYLFESGLVNKKTFKKKWKRTYTISKLE